MRHVSLLQVDHGRCHNGTVRTSLILTTTLALALASCGGSDGAEVATTSPPRATGAPSTEPAPTNLDEEPEVAPPIEAVELFSEDGELGVGYTSDGTDVSIQLLESSEWPTELAGANADNVKIFELEPDGAVFDEPVAVTRRVEIAAFDSLDLGPFDVPLVTMLTQNDAGEYEVLDDLSIVRIGPDLYVSGTTTHFSPIILSNENRMIPWGPGEGDGPVAPPLAETYLDPDEYLEIMRTLIAEPPAQLVIDEQRYLSGEELYDFVHKVIEEQERGDDDGAGASSEPTPPFGLFDDAGNVIESEALDPAPTSPADGAYRAERFGTSFPTMPVSLLPSTGELIGDPTATIAIAVWIPILVLTADALVSSLPTDPPVTDPPVTDPDVADCFMYLEMYPELVELDPQLPSLCEANVDAARSIISGLLDDLQG